MLLSRLSVPAVRAYEDRLRAEGRSPLWSSAPLVSLAALLAAPEERGLVARNVARDLRGGRRRGKERQSERRAREPPCNRANIPAPFEINAIWVLNRPVAPMLLTAIFTGLRVSELRGLRWPDVDLGVRLVHVRQRADRFNVIGSPSRPPRGEWCRCRI